MDVVRLCGDQVVFDRYDSIGVMRALRVELQVDWSGEAADRNERRVEDNVCDCSHDQEYEGGNEEQERVEVCASSMRREQYMDWSEDNLLYCHD